MCLSIALHRPDDVTGRGEHLGFEWITVHNGRGYRCGYVRIPRGHPWHGQGYDDVQGPGGDAPKVHGGLTFTEPDVNCGKGGPDDAWWLGFDTGHAFDAPDPALPQTGRLSPEIKAYLGMTHSLEAAGAFPNRDRLGSPFSRHVWTQPDIEAECRDLCRQAAEVASAPTPAA
jgi:hypothetical protein